MLTEAKRKKLLERLTECNRDVSEIRRELNILNDQKESEFSKRGAVGKEIVGLIRQIKQLKKNRDKFTALVKDHKAKRKESRDLLSEKINKFKELNGKKKEFMKKHKLKFGPDKVREHIEKLELRIETEAIPFSEEKKLMKQINQKKKMLKEVKELNSIFTNSKGLSKEIDDLKVDIEDNHYKIQNFAKQSQEKHEEMIKLSKEIDELKKKETEHMGKFVDFKEKFTKVNDKLKAKLPELNEIRENLDKHKKAVKEKKKKKIEKTLKDKEDRVEEKIRRMEKLTTEDLLVFQKVEES